VQLLMVLDDGETYSGLSDCSIVAVPDGLNADEVEAVLEEDEDVLVASFRVNDDGLIHIVIDKTYVAEIIQKGGVH